MVGKSGPSSCQGPTRRMGSTFFGLVDMSLLGSPMGLLGLPSLISYFILFSNLQSRDRLRWKENKKQEFSVMSAYQVALRLNRAEVVEHSLAWEDKKLWNKVWRLGVPPKVRNLVWRACSDILPTRANLFRRKIPINPLCTVCGQVDETVTHTLWECPLARNVWALVRGKLQKCGAAAPNFHLLARQMVAKLMGPELELWAMVSRSIWNARNRYHFEAKQSQPSDILRGATSLLQVYQRLNSSLARP